MNKATVKVVVSRRFEFPPEKVFNAWLIPQEASRFLFSTPTGRVVKAEIEPRVGGRFLIEDERDGAIVAHAGRYLALERPRRLAFAFSVPKYTSEETTVSLEFNPAGKGCELTLTHEGVWEDYAERTRQGWTGMLEKLDETLRA